MRTRRRLPTPCRQSRLARKKPPCRKSRRRIPKPTSFISRADSSGTNALRTICGDRSTTSTRRSRKIRTMRWRMLVLPKRGTCSRLSMGARRKIVFQKPRVQPGKRSRWMTLCPMPMLLWHHSQHLTGSIIPGQLLNMNSRFS